MNPANKSTDENYTEKVEEIITDSTRRIFLENNINIESLGRETPIYSEDSPIDSLNLVMLISDIEHVIGEQYNREIVLADEKAMSTRNSPFRSVGSLADYVCKLLNTN